MREDLVLLEDNTYGVFRAAGAELPTLKSLDTGRRVIYLSSFAKSVFPGARVGFLVADQDVVGHEGRRRSFAEELAKLKSMFTVNTGAVAQALVGGALIASGHSLRAANREAAQVYREKLDTITASLAEHFPPDRIRDHGVRWTRPDGGFFVLLRVPFPTDLAAAERSARDYGVCWAPVNPRHTRTADGGLIKLGFASLAVENIREGIGRLSRFAHETPPQREEPVDRDYAAS
ncbi:aminotransferase class I/II-fold pyridoxal phosphate-dependent enzyme [Amycolatopsis sp. cg13]|uniref:aminotransferase class I/II-fold pyridoxal phosphate-dependent enzyme n=1 Tax=Amycolatopsis sp. cg13 TaxID=3238807 RepID=UPI003524EA8A